MTGADGNGSLETVISIADRDIYDADGVLLVAKGRKITPQIYRRLLERKVVLPRQGTESAYSSPQTPDGGQVVAAVARLTAAIPGLDQDLIATAAARVGELIENGRQSFWSIHLKALVGYAGWVYSHSLNVALMAVMIGEKLGLARQAGQAVGLGALLHDVGMVLVPPEAINRADPLRPEEVLMVKQHPRVGCDMLRPLALEDAVLTVVGQHHERCDGSGYPAGIRGGEISLLASIVAVADTFDLYTSGRESRTGLEPHQALEAIKSEQYLFWPEVVAGLEAVLRPAWQNASGG